MGNLLKKTVVLAAATVLGTATFNAGAASSNINHTFTTELQEVRAGSVNGEEYLTIHINSFVGPASCHGSVLRVSSQSVNQPGKQEAMESIAMEAMLTSEPVVITVPLSLNRCVDGMPTLIDIDLAAKIY